MKFSKLKNIHRKCAELILSTRVEKKTLKVASQTSNKFTTSYLLQSKN